MVHINGEDLNLAGRSLQSYLDENEYVPGRFVVEYNLQIIRQDSYDNIILKDGDSVEIVMFMGGGSRLKSALNNCEQSSPERRLHK